MVGATEGTMPQSENLFSTPARLRKLSVHIEPLWEVGDDVLGLSFFSHPTKGSEGMWVSTVQLAGSFAWEAASTLVQHQVIRSGNALWAVQPQHMTYQQALDHIGIEE